MNGIFYFLMFLSAVSACRTGVFSSPWEKGPDVCLPPLLGGVKYILQMRHGYGWGENTHRANIALAVSKWRFSPEDKEKTDLFLERRLTKLLLRNSSFPISVNDLALYINALIATKKNPRNFRGFDLVKDLLARINHEQDLHPFLADSLCNAHSVDFHHLQRIMRLLSGKSLHTRDVEMKAMALKAFACASTLPGTKSRQFSEAMEEAAQDLILSLKRNTTLNVFTISLVVQALNAYGKSFDEGKALEYLRMESDNYPSIIKAYYIEMALNSRSVKFIKDLYDGPYDPEQRSTMEKTITVSIKIEDEPGKDFTVVIKVSREWNLLQILDHASSISNKLRCSYFLDQNRQPTLIQVGEQPNDPEKDLYWRICQDPYLSRSVSIAPTVLRPADGVNILLLYGTSECSSEE